VLAFLLRHQSATLHTLTVSLNSCLFVCLSDACVDVKKHWIYMGLQSWAYLPLGHLGHAPPLAGINFFYKFDVSKIDTRSGFVSLLNGINRQVAAGAKDSTGGAYSASPNP